ncbi:hypothetical protein [Thiopseudomonas denitrificans]|nr:hypothetical protein [Thiopseudomonas denitrificans]
MISPKIEGLSVTTAPDADISLLLVEILVKPGNDGCSTTIHTL